MNMPRAICSNFAGASPCKGQALCRPELTCLLVLQTWVIQYINLLAGNVGLVILSGQFLKVGPCSVTQSLCFASAPSPLLVAAHMVPCSTALQSVFFKQLRTSWR